MPFSEKKKRKKREISLNLLISIFFSLCRLKMKSYFIALCTFFLGVSFFSFSSRQFKLLPRKLA